MQGWVFNEVYREINVSLLPVCKTIVIIKYTITVYIFIKLYWSPIYHHSNLTSCVLFCCSACVFCRTPCECSTIYCQSFDCSCFLL